MPFNRDPDQAHGKWEMYQVRTKGELLDFSERTSWCTRNDFHYIEHYYKRGALFAFRGKGKRNASYLLSVYQSGFELRKSNNDAVDLVQFAEDFKPFFDSKLKSHVGAHLKRLRKEREQGKSHAVAVQEQTGLVRGVQPWDRAIPIFESTPSRRNQGFSPYEVPAQVPSPSGPPPPVYLEDASTLTLYGGNFFIDSSGNLYNRVRATVDVTTVCNSVQQFVNGPYEYVLVAANPRHNR